MAGRAEVGVVGLACRFPGGVCSPEQLWELLTSGRDAIGPMPSGRFALERFAGAAAGSPGKIATTEGGFLNDVAGFDADFFGISAREARKIDPQHRLLLELAWEAMEDGGVVPSSLAGPRTGVYVGIWSGEYENVMYRWPEDLDFHSVTGGGRYSASGRLSFCYDLRGPTVTVDSGCSASLAALHLACQGILAGEIDAAVVGAANLILQPHVNIAYSRSGMLSSGGRCRFGDADAGGYVRSDGAAVVILKRLDRAREDRNLVRGIVLSTGVNADGRASGQLATPSAAAQRELLEQVYARSGVDPRSVHYVEAHGTGTRAGDPVEIQALGEVLGKGRDPGRPLLVGSVKTVIGHTEACAGLAGLIKSTLALEHRWIPGNLHFQRPNPDIPWNDLGVTVPAQGVPWPEDRPLVAGVSSFGITGTNAHVVLAAASLDRTDRPSVDETRPHVVLVSGHTEAALLANARRLNDWVRANSPRIDDLSLTTTCKRDHLPHRLAVVAESCDQLSAALANVTAGEVGVGTALGAAPEESPRIAFVFSGQGSQWVGMGRELLDTCPVFADTLREADHHLRSMVSWSLASVMAGDEPLVAIDVIQPALASVQIALARQLMAWGLRPHAVLGHSMGEVPAAHVAGALSLDRALRVLVARSKLLAEIAGQGAMALVDADLPTLEAQLKAHGNRLSVAAINGPRSTVVSGDPEAVDRLVADMEAASVFARRVQVDVASHSAQTDPLLPRLREALRDLQPTNGPIAFHSTVTAGPLDGERLDAAYWATNLRNPVRLHPTAAALLDDGVRIFVEIAPHPVLSSSLADIAADRGSRPAIVAPLRRQEPQMRRLLDAVGQLHVAGARVEWEKLADGEARVLRPPAYAWQKESHWLDRWEDWSAEGSSARSVRWPDEAEALLYRLEWEEVAPPSGSLSATPERWLLVGDDAGIAGALTRRRTEVGGAIARVQDPSEVVEELRASHSAPAGVLFVADPRWSALESSDALRRVAQAIGPEPTRLLVVTRGSQNLPHGTPAPSGVGAASLWGFGRVLRDEHPEYEVTLVDLDPEASADADADVLERLLVTAPLERDLAVRQNRFWAPRLTRLAPPPPVAGRARWPERGTTLITGGLGDLGLAVARHLVDQGVRRLALLSRSPLPPRDEWASLQAAGRQSKRVTAIRELEEKGASIHVAAVDVGDPRSVDGFLRDWEAQALPPIVAVVHTAGVVDSHLVDNLPSEALERVFHGKGNGASNLDRAFPHAERFVLFSSTSVVIPQAGESNYAAANAFLDALAAERRARGAEAQVINWGVWEGSGVIANEQGARYVAEVKRQGIGAMAPELAVEIFDRIVAANVAQTFVAPVDWERLTTTRGAGHLGRVFERLTSRSTATTSVLDTLAATSAADRPQMMQSVLRDLVGRVLGVPSERIRTAATLGSQGLDSLMALELRNLLEGTFDVNVSATIAWNYPTIEKLSNHLLPRVGAALERRESPADTPALADGPEVTSSPPVPGDVTGLAALMAEVATLSEADALGALRKAR